MSAHMSGGLDSPNAAGIDIEHIMKSEEESGKKLFVNTNRDKTNHEDAIALNKVESGI